MTTNHCPNCQTAIPSGAPGGFCPACVLRGAEETAPVAAPGSPSLEEVRAAFPQLEVEGLIGQGGMGSVYKARQPSLDRTVALKILSPALSRDPAFAERFAREARVLGRLSHPNIVTVYEHGQSGAFYYLLMEYVDGVNLRQAMQAGRFTPEQALAVVPGICDALQAAHAEGIWHRDIKPENILLDARGGVKIADFGIARLAGDPQQAFTLTMTGARLGSAAYMAPEQHEKPHDVDHRADIYSLGVVIYEMLTGELPLGRFKAPSTKAAVDARIDEIVLRTLEKERELRQQSAAEVKTGVADAAHPPPQPTAAATTPRASLLISFKMGIAAGVVLLVSAGFLTHGSTQGVLMSFAFVIMAVGLIGAFVYRGKRPPVRISRGAVLALVAFIVIAACWVYFEQQRLRAEAEAKAIRHAQDVARASMEERVNWLKKAKASPAVTPPPADTATATLEKSQPDRILPPKETPDEFLKRLNKSVSEFATELEKIPAGEARERAGMAGLGRFRSFFAMSAPCLTPKSYLGNSPESWALSQVTGTILVTGSDGLGNVFDDPLGRIFAGVTAGLKSNDRVEWVRFTLLQEGDEWKYFNFGRPFYSTACRFTFRPPSPAVPLDVIKNYLGDGETAVTEVEPGLFQISICNNGLPSSSAGKVKEKLTNIEERIDLDGFRPYYKLTQPPVEPRFPMGVSVPKELESDLSPPAPAATQPA